MVSPRLFTLSALALMALVALSARGLSLREAFAASDLDYQLQVDECWRWTEHELLPQIQHAIWREPVEFIEEIVYNLRRYNKTKTRFDVSLDIAEFKENCVDISLYESCCPGRWDIRYTPEKDSLFRSSESKWALIPIPFTVKDWPDTMQIGMVHFIRKGLNSTHLTVTFDVFGLDEWIRDNLQ